MRLVFNLNSGGTEIPYDHSYRLYSAILQSLRAVDPSFASSIHDGSFIPKFCISQLLPGGKRVFGKTGIWAERFIFIISSLNDEFLAQIKQKLDSQKEIFLGDISLPIYSIKSETVYVSSEIVNMITRSPIVLKYGGKYITSNDEDFPAILQQNITSKYKKVQGVTANIKFLRITSAKSKLSTLKSAGIPSSMITFTISADYELLEFITRTGIGAKTQMGFGFVEEQKRGIEHDF